MITVVVEGRDDRKIVQAFLKKAEIFDAKVVCAERKTAAGRFDFRWLDSLNETGPWIVIYEQESGSVADAETRHENEQFVHFCPAIPTIDAWLFADSEVFFEIVGRKAEQFFGRMPLPEQLPYPRFLRSRMLGKPELLEKLLDRIDILVAGARSPSLKHFIQTSRREAGLPALGFDDASNTSGQINREILRNLINEIYPSDKALFRAASGAVISAEQMMQEITNGTELGREYGSDVLRVARDLLSRQAQSKIERD